MTIGRKVIFTTLILLSCTKFFGQDVHFSTISTSDMFLNPAKTAFSPYDFKVGAAYRNQWQTISVSGYNTSLLSAEARLFSSRQYRHSFGIGLMFMQDVAGSLDFGEQQISLSVSYNKQLTKNHEQFLSLGLSFGRTTWGYDATNADFGRFDSDDEGILLSKISTFDLSAGVHWQISPVEEQNISAGVAVFHINNPTYSFYDNTSISLMPRYTLYATYLFPTSEQSKMQSILRFNKQNDNYELVAGLEWIFSLSTTVFDIENIAAGIFYRSNDAMIITLSYRFNELTAGLAYDVNLSSLSKVSHTYGAVELWASYGINRFKYKRQTKTIPCPTF